MVDRTKQAVFGFATDIGGHFVLTAATFIVTPVILNFTSNSLYGFWVASLSILVYLGLVDLGLGISLTRLVAGVSDRLDSNKLNHVVSTAFFTFCLVGLAFLGIGLGVSSYIPVWFKISANESETVILAYRIVIVAGALALPLSTFNAIIAGVQRMAINNTIRNVAALVEIGLAIILLYRGVGLPALAISKLFTVLVTGVVSYFFCMYRCCDQLKISLRFINRTDLGRLCSFGGYFQLGRIGEMIATSTDVILLAAILGAAAVTPYALTSKLAVLISSGIASKLPIALFPALSNMFARQEMDKLRRAFVGLAYYSSRLAVVGGIFIIVANRQFVSLWVSPQFFGGNILNIVFVSWVFLNTIFHGTGIVLKASGDLRKWSIASVIEAILNIGISLLLIRPLGLVGVALGTTIARSLTTGIYVPTQVCRKLQLPIRSFLWKGVVYPILRSLPASCLVILFAVLVPSKSGWLWLALVGSVAFAGNVFSFECLQLAKPSNKPFRKRSWNVFLLRSILD